MHTISKIFIDTNVFVALEDEEDSTHKKAVKLALYLKKNNIRPHTSSDVIGETLTVISKKLGKKATAYFFKNYQDSDTDEIFIDEELHTAARKLFFNSRSKNISFIDCSSVVAMKKAKIDVIFSFDKHFKSLGVKLLSDVF